MRVYEAGDLGDEDHLLANCVGQHSWRGYEA